MIFVVFRIHSNNIREFLKFYINFVYIAYIYDNYFVFYDQRESQMEILLIEIYCSIKNFCNSLGIILINLTMTVNKIHRMEEAYLYFFNSRIIFYGFISPKRGNKLRRNKIPLIIFCNNNTLDSHYSLSCQ